MSCPDDDVAECVCCGLESHSADRTWKPGEVCLFGNLFACSMACAEKWAAENASVGFRPGETKYEAVMPAGPVKQP